MLVSPRLQKYFDQYAESHKNKVNLMIHKVAIPLIIFHISAMLTWVHLFSIHHYTISLAEFMTLGAFIFYLSLNIRYALIMLVYFVLCIFIAHITPVWLVWAITIFAWVIQLLGHAIWEKRAPAFTENFLQLLVGPLFFLNKVLN